MPPISALKHLGLTQGNPFGDTMGSATSPTSPHILASVGRMYRSVPQSHFYSTAWTHQSIMDMSPHSHGISQPGSVMLQQISCSALLFSAVYFLLEADLGLLWVWSSSRNLGIPCCILSFHPAGSRSPSTGHLGSLLHRDRGILEFGALCLQPLLPFRYQAGSPPHGEPHFFKLTAARHRYH